MKFIDGTGLSTLENGQRSIDKSMAKRFAPALEIDWTMLTEGSDKSVRPPI